MGRTLIESTPLFNTVARLEGELASVEALKDLKDELIQQKEVIIVRKWMQLP